MSVLLAIDPGATGRIALFIEGRLDNMLPATPQALASRLESYRQRRVVIEQVNGAPGQSGPASFNFGRAYGELLGVCIALGLFVVALFLLFFELRLFGKMNGRYRFGLYTAELLGVVLAVAWFFIFWAAWHKFMHG